MATESKKAAAAKPASKKTTNRDAPAAAAGAGSRANVDPAIRAKVGEQEERPPGGGIKHKLEGPVSPVETYADGAHAVMVGRNVLKLDLYSVTRIDGANNEEIRKITQRVVMPLTAVRELATLLEGIMRAGQEAVKQQEAAAAAAKSEKSAAA